LCKTMQHIEFKKGQIVMQGGENGINSQKISLYSDFIIW
jgi:hypothetical protein